MQSPRPLPIALALAIAAHLGVSRVSGQQESAEKFEVVSVKANTGADLSIQFEPAPPDGFRRSNLPLYDYVRYAFDIPQPSRMADAPEWIHTTRYDITGKAAGPINERQRQAMMRDVLATRFNLRTHIEQREQTVLVMTPDRADRRLGSGLRPRPDCADQPCSAGGTGRPDGVTIRATTLTRFADGMMSNLLRQIVRDETGVSGLFDVEATWRPQAGAVDPTDTRADLFTAFKEQLGLKLEPARRMVDVLVIDRIERPSEN